MATHSSILAWRIPWTEESWDHKELDMTEQLSISTIECLLGNKLLRYKAMILVLNIYSIPSAATRSQLQSPEGRLNPFEQVGHVRAKEGINDNIY